MKRFCVVTVILISVMLIGSNIFCGAEDKGKSDDSKLQASISDKIIRFHVLANSDSDKDQKLKLKVKDEVLKMIAPELEKSKSIDESRKILKKDDKRIRALAEKIIKQNGYNYSVKTELARENFPVKTYGNITLPQGSYEAYRILIGEAEGHNWWCVMFPPLCFIDVTKGEVAEKQTDAEMGRVLNSKELQYIDNESDDDKVELRFKIIDEIKKIFQ